MRNTCMILSDWEQRTSPPCGQPAAAAVTFGCEHEHLTTLPACTGCARRLDGIPGSCVICRACVDGPAPHRCDAMITIRPLETVS